METHQSHPVPTGVIDANPEESALKFGRNSTLKSHWFLAFVLLIVAAVVVAVGCGQDAEQAAVSETAPAPQVQEEVQPTRPQAPEFTLPAANKGTDISLAQFQGDKPVVLVFYRAYW